MSSGTDEPPDMAEAVDIPVWKPVEQTPGMDGDNPDRPHDTPPLTEDSLKRIKILREIGSETICLKCGYAECFYRCGEKKYVPLEKYFQYREARKSGRIDRCALTSQPHYASNDIEPIDYIKAQGWFPDFACGNVVKYISRYRLKNGVEDLEKARVYLDWLIAYECRGVGEDDRTRTAESDHDPTLGPPDFPRPAGHNPVG